MVLDLPLSNALEEIEQDPKEYDYDLQQHFVNYHWESNPERYTIKQQVDRENKKKYHDIEVHINHALDKTTGLKLGDDFKQLIFKEVTYYPPRGLYYKFFDNTWLCINTDNTHRLASKNTFVRRCNNAVRWEDKDTGVIHNYPCIIEYAPTSPMPQVDEDLLTPNNHIVIILQGNRITTQIKQNYRFIFNDRPFKITGYNNYMNDDSLGDTVPLLYLDAYLDETSPYDDFKNGLAYNFLANAELTIDQGNFTQSVGYEGALTATCRFNGNIIDSDVLWYTSNKSRCEVTTDGHITIVGGEGQSVEIMAVMKDNKRITDKIEIAIANALPQDKSIKMKPLVTEIKQGTKVEVEFVVVENGVELPNVVSVNPSGPDVKHFNLTPLGGNKYEIACKQTTIVPLVLYCQSDTVHQSFSLMLKALF